MRQTSVMDCTRYHLCAMGCVVGTDPWLRSTKKTGEPTNNQIPDWFLSYQTLVMKVAVFHFYHTKHTDWFSWDSDAFQLFLSVHPSKDNYTLLKLSVHTN